MPAKNLFLNDPKLGKILMDNVQIKNVIGRAGRMLKHFAGNVFLINVEQWQDNYDLDDSSKKVDKIPTFFDILNHDITGITDVLNGNQPTSKPDTYYAIANKLIKEYEDETISKTLSAKELTIDTRKKGILLDAIKSAYLKLNIESYLVHTNPDIGYIQQNRLHDFLLKQINLAEWVLPFPTSSEVYNQLVRILTELNNMDLFLPTKSIKQLVHIAHKWLQGVHLDVIIADHIKWLNRINKFKNTNTCVREVIGIINTDIRFKMVSALRCYDTILTRVIALRELNIKSTKLHAFIEFGGYKERFINLTSLGLSRDTSIEIDHILGEQTKIETIENLKKLFEQNQLGALHTVMKNEIRRLLY